MSSTEQNWLAGVTPSLFVSDVKKSLAFYEAAFGFTALPDPKDMHAVMRYKEFTLMVYSNDCGGSGVQTPAVSGHPSPMNLYIYVDDVDALHRRAVEAGARSDSEPKSTFWGDRIASLTDMDGYSWLFATKDKADADCQQKTSCH